MARHVERLAAINDGEELWKIAVRIHLIWNVVSNNKEHFEMIFGDDIHVVVPASHVSVFNKKCLLGHTYIVSNLSPVKLTYLYQMSLEWWTILVMHRLIWCKETANNNMLNCTIWESYADQFIRFNKYRVDAPVPTNALLQYAKMMEEGKFLLSVTNTYNVTLLCVDADFPLMKDFIEKMSKESRVTLSDQLGSNSQLSSQNSENSQLTPVQKLLSKVVVLPIAEIIQLKDYKIEIEVTHGGQSCNFVFWNRESEMLLGLSTSQLRNTMIECGITDPLDFPLALDQMFKLEMAIKDLEITSEHKPDAVAPAGKRHFPGASSESTTLEGLCDGEISSNKLKKIIKS
ncbi:uncharacterized protein LOC131627774 [Vicia villosa]|uniref:uncharacterized protein LOC131627774 n=1 Tax=Vicia villosa TaxID=3911 RepID=UPI00273BCF4B|nr:uncharacterized protein LOC131627774 [Vicia villosa]